MNPRKAVFAEGMGNYSEVVELRRKGSMSLIVMDDALCWVASDALRPVVVPTTAGFGKIPLLVDDEDRVMDWFTSSSAARIARVVAFGQKILDERFADGAFE